VSELIQQLATIEVSSNELTELAPDEIFRNFSSNFAKLGDLKKFKSEHEKKNFIVRWLQSGRLADAQLDSAVVQAEFSKAIGQLMMISVLQSKKLSAQQQTLTSQQAGLERQAKEILSQTEEIAVQQETQAQQAKSLQSLVENYFELKGLTQDGAAKLIAIAMEVRGTKDSMIEDVSRRLLGMRQALDENLTRVDDHVLTLTQKVDESALLSRASNELLGQKTANLASALEQAREGLTTSLTEQSGRTEALLKNLEDVVQRVEKGAEESIDCQERVAVLEQQSLAAIMAMADVKSSGKDQSEKLDKLNEQLGRCTSRLKIISAVAGFGVLLGLIGLAMLIVRH
jgi:hypothetical protein